VEEFTEFNPYGLDLGKLSRRFFGVSERFVKEVEKLITEIYHIIDNDNLKKLGHAEKLIEKLELIVGSDDEEVVRSKSLIDTIKLMSEV
jgi:hypothetical protein